MAQESGYYAVIPGWLITCDQISDGAKLFFGEVSRRCNERGYCWASNGALASDLNRGERTITRWVAELESVGAVTTEIVDVSSAGRHERRIRLTDALNLGSPKLAGLANFGEGRVAKNGDPILSSMNKQSKNNNPQPPAIGKLLAEYAAGNADLEAALDGFVEMRKQQKKPINTARQVAILTGKLDRLSGGDDEAKIAMLDLAVEHGWLSVYELREREREELRHDRGGGEEAFGVWT